MKLLFISYINRSGSTFLANSLSKFNSILVCPEAEVLVYYFIQRKYPIYRHPGKLYSVLTDLLTKDPKLKFWNLNISDFNDLHKYQSNFEIFFDILIKYKNKVKPESTTIVFKADNIAYFYNNIPDEAYKRNNIKIISIIRDGRASYSSQRETIGARTKKPMNRNPVKAARLWRKWIRFFANHKNDSRFIIVRYEEFIINYPDFFENLLNVLGLQNEIKNRIKNGDLYNRIPPDQILMHENILKPPMQENIWKWKILLPLSHIMIFERIAHKELIQENYEFMHPKSNNALYYFLFLYYWIILLYQSSAIKKWMWKVGKYIAGKIGNFSKVG